MSKVVMGLKGFGFGLIFLMVTGCAGLPSAESDAETESVELSPTFRPWVSAVGGPSGAGSPSGGGRNPAGSDRVALVDDLTTYEIRTGDPLVVNLRGIYPRDETIENIVDEYGNISMPLLGDILVDGLTPSQLSARIRQMYIDGGYYRSLTVNVVMPSRSYFIRGEVRGPGRYPIMRGMTLLQAVTAAGGYTEFANSRSVKVIRSGLTTTYDLRDIERNPELDIRIQSGDVIVVDRSRF